MKIRTLGSWLCIFLVSLMVGVSCNSSQLPSAVTSPSTNSTTAPIRFGFHNWPGGVPWQIADEQKIFDENKVNVDLIFYDYLGAVKAMASGKTDVSTLALNDIITSVASDSKFDPVMVLLTDVSTGGDQIIVRKGINKLADLKGKKIATELGSVDHFLLLLGLRKAGINPDNVQLQNREMQAAVGAFIEGKVDAVVTFIPFTDEALKLRDSKVLFSSKDFPGVIPSYLVVERKLIQERPQDVQALVNSWFAILEAIRKNPEQSSQIMIDQLGVTLEQFKKYKEQVKLMDLTANLQAFQEGSDMTSSPYAAQTISQFLFDNKIIDKKPDLSRLFDDQFIKAYKSSHP